MSALHSSRPSSNEAVDRGTARGKAALLGMNWRVRDIAAMAMTICTTLSILGFLYARPSQASTVTQTGDVFASTGSGTVGIYDAASGDLTNALNDGTGEAYTAGGVFDGSNHFYVADDTTGGISEYNSSGELMPQFATGLINPLSLAFDSSANLYVGQQLTPYVAEFDSSGTRLPDIGPMTTELYGTDWIDLASDECTLDYTTEGTDVLQFNKCTNQQLSNFNAVPFTGVAAYEMRIRPNGEVLVADSGSVIRLGPSGNVMQSYSCASLPGCAGQLFALNLDPDGTSFWTGDSYSGDIWRVDIATGDVLQTIETHSGSLFGLTINGQITVATSPATVIPVTGATTSLSVNPATGDYADPTPVSAVLTDANTHAAIAAEPVALMLNGAESCTAVTDGSGTATCPLTPSEPAATYTLTAAFAGDSTQLPSLSSSSGTSSFVVTLEESALSYTGASSAVNGQAVILSGALTTDDPSAGYPLVAKVVQFTLGAGATTQTCSATSDSSGAASCLVSAVNQSIGIVPVTASFAGDTFYRSATSSSNMGIRTPSALSINPGTGDFADLTAVSGVLTNLATAAPLPGEPVTFNLNGTQKCTGITDGTGLATCSITPNEAAGTYSLAGAFAGDISESPQLLSQTAWNSFVVTPEESAISYTGSKLAVSGQSTALSGILSTDDPVAGTALAGKGVLLTLGTGSGAQSCTATTNDSGLASCTIAVVIQAVGSVPVTASFAGDPYYRSASASSSVNVGAPPPTELSTTLTVGAATGDFGDASSVSGVLSVSSTGAPVVGEPVIFTLNGVQSCTGTTSQSGLASCSITPGEPAASYALTGSFAGDTARTPKLLSDSGSSTFIVTLEESTLAYTGAISAVTGKPMWVSAILTTDDPSTATALVGRTVVLTLGTGISSQSCSATTATSGLASCSIASVNQTLSSVPVTARFAGDTFYGPADGASDVAVSTATTLTVSAASGDFADATTVSAVLTNSATSAMVSGEQVTFTLNGTQTCTADTGPTGKASCSVTPSEPAATYSLTATFRGDATKASQLLSSSGSNNFVVTLEETAITYTGSVIVVTGQPMILSGVLTTDDPSTTTPLMGRVVTFTLGSGTSAQSCHATTNVAGVASCVVASAKQTDGHVPVSAAFDGDAYYRPSSAESAGGGLPVASPPSIGAFDTGDVSSGHPTVGADVTFWGAQWAKDNTLSGGGAPASMKGYIDSAVGYTCGTTWTTDTGNSSDPPSTIPNDMVVIVSNKVTQSGSVISGTILHMVIVSVNSGYGSNPGHGGTGKIIATIC